MYEHIYIYIHEFQFNYKKVLYALNAEQHRSF